MHSGKTTEIENEQQPREQKEKLKIDTCKTCGQHTARGITWPSGTHAGGRTIS